MNIISFVHFFLYFTEFATITPKLKSTSASDSCIKKSKIGGNTTLFQQRNVDDRTIQQLVIPSKSSGNLNRSECVSNDKCDQSNMSINERRSPEDILKLLDSQAQLKNSVDGLTASTVDNFNQDSFGNSNDPSGVKCLNNFNTDTDVGVIMLQKVISESSCEQMDSSQNFKQSKLSCDIVDTIERHSSDCNTDCTANRQSVDNPNSFVTSNKSPSKMESDLSTKPEQKKSFNLLTFIEHSSPELIFLLSESAKLSYQLSLFEEKLDCLEGIFAIQENDSSSQKFSSEDGHVKWVEVIARTRKWVDNVRSTNVFMKKVEKPFVSKKKLLNKLRTASNSHLRTCNSLSFPEDKNEIAKETRKTSSLSSEDELIILLDRIAQFSSNIMSKRKFDNLNNSKLKSTSIFNQDKSSNDSQVDINSIVIEEKLSNKSVTNKLKTMKDCPKDILVQLFSEFESGKISLGKDTFETGIDRDRMYSLQPDILKALFRITKISARLVQIQQEFEVLMCAYLKSTGQSLNKSKQSNSNQFSGVSLPPIACNEVVNKKHARSSVSQTKPVSHKNTPPSQCHKCLKPIENRTDSMLCHDVFQDAKSQNCCGNFVSDGDSGGEFTATTVTNEFNQSAAEDELSSLLNQIALCSQKLIEQNTANSTNSTTSSGCCCSTSMETKCAGTCSIGHNSRFINKELSPYDILADHDYPGQTAHDHRSWVAPNGHCCNNTIKKHSSTLVNCVSRNSLPKQMYSHNSGQSGNSHYHENALRAHMTFENLNKLNEAPYLKRSSYANVHQNRVRNYIQKQKRWSLGQNVGEHFIYQDNMPTICFDNTSDCYARDVLGSPTKHNSPKRHLASHDLIDEWLINEPFMDCVSNNANNFMLSTSMGDVLSPVNSHPRCNRYHRHQYSTDPKFNVVSSNDCTQNSASAFIFDPTVDVQSFLNEVEKELDDNCFASAPPFLARAQCSSQANSHYNINSIYDCSTPSYQCNLMNGTDHHGTYQQSRGTHPTPGESFSSALVNNIASPMYSSLNSPSRSTNPVPPPYAKHISPGNATNQSSIAGSNWRLSQRNSIAGFEPSTPVSHNHFPFPAMTSMPITCDQIDPPHRYKRLILPSTSRDLLEKFRAQVSYRVNEETENQLREIDQWLHEQLQMSSRMSINNQYDGVDPQAFELDPNDQCNKRTDDDPIENDINMKLNKILSASKYPDINILLEAIHTVVENRCNREQ